MTSHASVLALTGFAACSFITACRAQERPLVAEAAVYADGKYLIHTPSTIRTQISVASKAPVMVDLVRGDWYLNGKRCGREAAISAAAPPKGASNAIDQLSTSWRRTEYVDVALRCELNSAGNYSLEYRVTNGKGDLLASPVKVGVTILAATGVDLQAYEFQENCYQANKAVVDAADKCRHEMIARFPESLYSAWALAKINDPMGPFMNETGVEAFADYLLDHAKENAAATSPEIAYSVGNLHDFKKPDEMRAYVEHARKALAAHEDFPLAGRVAGSAGASALALGDIPTACELLDKATRLKWEEPEAFGRQGVRTSEGVILALARLRSRGACK